MLRNYLFVEYKREYGKTASQPKEMCGHSVARKVFLICFVWAVKFHEYSVFDRCICTDSSDSSLTASRILY